jgi:DNA replication protein DnaC
MNQEDCIYKDVCTQDCKDNCIRFLEMDYLLHTSNIPKSKQKALPLIPDSCDMDSFIELSNIRDNIKEFVETSQNLYLYSENCGNGKTSWAIKLMLQYFNEVWAGNGFTNRGVFIHVPTFLIKYKSTISKPDEDFEHLKDKILNTDLVIWDDIASTKLSEYDYSILLTYLDQRTLYEKSNIFTGNILPEKLSQVIGLRLASRICGDNTIKIQLKGGDNR